MTTQPVSGGTDQPTTAPPVKICDRCGGLNGEHGWVEGDCVLRHKTHSRKLVDGTNVCHWCVVRHRTWLRECLDLYATLELVLEPGSIPDDTADYKRAKKPADAPSPVRLEAWALLFDAERLHSWGRPSDLPNVPGVLSGWAQNACDDRDLAGASLDGTVMTAVRLLTEHAEFIAGRPWVDTYDAELSWVRQALRRAHGVSEGKQPVGLCPSLDGDGQECGGPLWPDRHGAMAVTCGTCRREFNERFLRLLGGMLETNPATTGPEGETIPA